MSSDTLEDYMSINCYNPACGESFENDSLRARHCSAVPACRQARLQYFSSDFPPAVKRRRTRIKEVEDEDQPYQTSFVPQAHADFNHDTSIDMEGPASGRPASQSNNTTRPPPDIGLSSQEPGDQEHAKRQHGAPYTNGRFSSLFERLREEQTGHGQSPFGVFEDEEHWELVEWIVESGLSTDYVERLLKLKIVSCRSRCGVDDLTDICFGSAQGSPQALILFSPSHQ
jgi:hypothetical protein